MMTGALIPRLPCCSGPAITFRESQISSCVGRMQPDTLWQVPSRLPGPPCACSGSDDDRSKSRRRDSSDSRERKGR